ncbi:TRAP transporter small permease [Rhodophyticola sp. CCM32]|uniref:TRAP transporter small permease n=1 Tax=Rhodophyticola sp. CCM32 TaxID=2916397 RepID=UPI00107FA435|nr:TRAP transporter small permease [Rhodophyticola sp. CCM32]QBY00462.1 TRAP transporter small permease [Rhodophyticola sp. CCM32]
MGLAPGWEAATGRLMEYMARRLAYGGGFVLSVLALMVCASILGRALDGVGLSPITGDYELVEAGCAIVVFAFLPWCQLKRGHVSVDIVMQHLPPRVTAFSGLVGDILLTVVAYVILWRLWLGFGEKFPYGSDTFRGVSGSGRGRFFPKPPMNWRFRPGFPMACR